MFWKYCIFKVSDVSRELLHPRYLIGQESAQIYVRPCYKGHNVLRWFWVSTYSPMTSTSSINLDELTWVLPVSTLIPTLPKLNLLTKCELHITYFCFLYLFYSVCPFTFCYFASFDENSPRSFPFLSFSCHAFRQPRRLYYYVYLLLSSLFLRYL